MCIIAIKPIGKKMFSKDELAVMFANNPDGAGFMYYDKKQKKVIIQKGYMNLNSLLKELNKKDLTRVNVVLHFRIKTSGFKDVLNCHPFPIYDTNATYCKTDIAVAHNGILKDFEPAFNSDINDTQVFIREVLRKLSKGFINSKNCRYLIKQIIGTNKLAFLDQTGRVTTIGNFIEDNGYLYSNTSYLPRAYTHASVYTPKTTSYVNKNVCTKVKSQTANTTKKYTNVCTNVKDNGYHSDYRSWNKLNYYGTYEDLEDSKWDDLWD